MAAGVRRSGPGAPLEAIETASRDELHALQTHRLKETLARAYASVPYYRRAFDACGVHPDDVREPADLGRLPFLTKAAFRDEYPLGLLAVPRERVARLHASSGTTGKPTVVAYTRADIDVWAAVVARSMRAAGVAPGDIVHIAYGYGLFTGGLGAHYGAERLGCTVVPVSGGQTEKQVGLIVDLQPTIVMVTPSYMLVLLDEMERRGIDPSRTSLEVGIFGAEPWSDGMRARLERRAAIDAVDIYGLSEVIGPGVACECVEEKNGLYIWEDHFYPEIVDPDTGMPLPDGAYGELVLTSLTKEAMPVIRYRTRDLTRLMPGTVRTMRRIERIAARSDDMLIVRGVNVFPSQIEEQVLRDPRLLPNFAVRLTRNGNLDAVTVLVSPGAAHDGTACADLLRARVKDAVGISIEVDVVAADALPASLGKVQRVLDLRTR